MGIFDVHARTWQAPSRQEQAHKSELHTLEEAEERKRRQMKNELETLRKVEDLQHESAEDARNMLQANARDSARRRAVSGLNDREALMLAQREHNTARLRNATAHPHSQMSPNLAMLASPALSSMGHVPTINIPSSPGLLSSGLDPNYMATPRMRSVSTHHPPMHGGLPVSPLLGGYQTPLSMSNHAGAYGSPSLGLPLPRARAASSVGLGTPATVERMRLEERKRALLHKEAQLQADREHRLMKKKSMLDLDSQELALRRKAQELDARAKLESQERYLDDQQAQLQHRQREQMLEAEMTDRLRHLSVNTPSLNPLHASPTLGHTRHLSSPMALAGDGYQRSPRLGPAHAMDGGSPMMGGNSHLGGDLLSSGGYGHQRSRSIGHSPLLGTHALEAEMAADAARLGLLPTGLGVGGFASRGGGAMGAGLDERSVAYARAGASPRFGPADAAYNSGYGGGAGSYGDVLGPSTGYQGGYDLGLDDLGGLGGNYPRSRRGSFNHGNDFSQGSGGFNPGFDGADLSRSRRDSLPFQH